MNFTNFDDLFQVLHNFRVGHLLHMLSVHPLRDNHSQERNRQHSTGPEQPALEQRPEPAGPQRQKRRLNHRPASHRLLNPTLR